MNLVEIGTRVLTSCMDVKADETVLVVTDDEKFQIGQTLYQAAKELGADAVLVTMSPREVSGQEPPASIAAAMKAADVVLCPMSTSITHTRAKIEAAKAGARIATMPSITEDMFRQGAMTADYDTVMELTNRVTEMLTKASAVRIEKDGHVLTLDLAGRPGIPSPGVYREKQPSSHRWKCFLSFWFSSSTSSVISASSTVSGVMFTSVLPFRFTPRMLTPYFLRMSNSPMLCPCQSSGTATSIMACCSSSSM